MTAPPTAPVDIYNLAMLQLYQEPITSFEDKSLAGRVGNRIYDHVRQTLLRNSTWNFARKRVELSPVANETPSFDYETYYQLPADCLKIHHLGEEWDLWDPIPYDIQGKRLLVNPTWQGSTDAGTSLKLEYTRDVTDPTQFDAMFTNLFKYALAAEAAMPITGNFDLAVGARKMFEIARKEAVMINHQERPTRVIRRDYVAEARGNDFDLTDSQLRVDPTAWP
jgi:hypothetical protein